LNSSATGLDLNTSGIRRSMGRPFPERIWADQVKKNKWFLGSDAHKTEQLALQFSQVAKDYGLLEDN
jgi:hypothetical protein